MEGIKAIGDTYLALGAGGLCLVAIIGVMFWLLRERTSERKDTIQREKESVEREAKRDEENRAQMKALIDSNKETNIGFKQALGELSRSTDNNTQAVKALTTIIDRFDEKMDTHDAKADQMARDVVETKVIIKERER
jgi:septal ring factor EnvC (AmiA/AmiB activator)